MQLYPKTLRIELGIIEAITLYMMCNTFVGSTSGLRKISEQLFLESQKFLSNYYGITPQEVDNFFWDMGPDLKDDESIRRLLWEQPMRTNMFADIGTMPALEKINELIDIRYPNREKY